MIGRDPADCKRAKLFNKQSATKGAVVIIGIPKEIKNSEFRVGLTDHCAKSLADEGHSLLIQKGAGRACGISDEDYAKAGACLLDSPEEIYARADMIVKVKEPLAKEYSLFKENQILFTFLHLAAEPRLTEALCAKGAVALAYETIEDERGGLPLLKPMSEIAGRVALLNGFYYLQKFTGGRGILAGGVGGAEKARVTILGGGTAGFHAAQAGLGLSADVCILDIKPKRLNELDSFFKSRVKTLPSNKENLFSVLKTSDLFIGSVLLKGSKAPKIITKEMIQAMPKNSFAGDISIDQGGCMETARLSSHEKPVYRLYDVLHYCVPNIPSAVSRTATYALSSASFPYIKAVANSGFKEALKSDPLLKKGLNVYKGYVACKPVAQALGLSFRSPKDLGL